MVNHMKMQEKLSSTGRFGVGCLTLFLGMLMMFLYFVPGAHAKNYIKIGLLEEPKTLNIWLATDAWSSKVLSPDISAPLYPRSQRSGLTPWLAAEQPDL
jgi:peptide/nickel transport system substrate-binding protein